jgi:hypothetical protein
MARRNRDDVKRLMATIAADLRHDSVVVQNEE